MSSAMPFGGSVTLTTSPQTLYDVAVDGGNFQQVWYDNRDGTNDAEIQVVALNGTASFYAIPPNKDRAFTCRAGRIDKVIAKSSASTVLLTGGPTAQV